jgi:hypothetical protein
MVALILADAVLVLHLVFVLFVLFGGLLTLKWERAPWLHLPAAAWGVLVEFSGWVCPLTPLENWLREQGGASGYADDFIGHYLQALLYPESLSRNTQFIFGTVALLVNGAIYFRLWQSGRRRFTRTHK